MVYIWIPDLCRETGYSSTLSIIQSILETIDKQQTQMKAE